MKVGIIRKAPSGDFRAEIRDKQTDDGWPSQDHEPLVEFADHPSHFAAVEWLTERGVEEFW